MSMWRRFVRRGAPVLALILALGLMPLHPTGSGDWDIAGRLWSWFVGVWSVDEGTPEGSTGGAGATNGTTGDGDRGAGIDPDGTP